MLVKCRLILKRRKTRSILYMPDYLIPIEVCRDEDLMRQFKKDIEEGPYIGWRVRSIFVKERYLRQNDY